MAGIAKKNENFAAFLLLIPNKSAILIVIPDLDMPGKIAMHCIIPIIKAMLNVKFLAFGFIYFVIKRIIPVTKNE